MGKKLKIGVIGVGNLSNQHIRSYLKNPDVELYAFCDINPDRLAYMGKQYGITRLYTDRAEMLALPELDAVSICTWNSEHAPCTIDALNAGKHVLCEKPMCIRWEDAQAMKEAAEKNGKLLMIGFVCRHELGTKILKEYIDNGSFGEIYYAKAVYQRRDGNPGGWFGDKKRSGGGPIIDLGVHFLDLTRYLAGNPKPVSVTASTYYKLGDRKGEIGKTKYLASSATDHDICDVEDSAVALIRYDNGMTLNLEVAFDLNMKEDRMEVMVFGTKAGATLYPALEIYGSTGRYQTNLSYAAATGDDPVEFQNEIDHFVDCLLGRAKCIAPAEDGVQIMRILNAIYESAETGREVLL